LNWFKRLIVDIHRRSMWQVLGIYLLGGLAAYQVIQSLTEGLGLPSWFPGLAIVLLIVFFPVVLAVAMVREQRPPVESRAGEPAEPRASEREPQASVPATVGERRRFSRRGAFFGVVAVFALWGLLAGSWFVFGRSESRSPAAGDDRRIKLVVLPFENLGPADDEYFADGITEEITSRLAEIPELGVISRSSALTYKGTTKDLPTIAAELDVDYVLEGTVRWERVSEGQSRVRVTPQLIRVDDDTNVWTERYDAVLSEILSVQSDIAEKVARALDITLLDSERRAIEQMPTANVDAYDYYLQCRDYFSRGSTREHTLITIQMCERAVELDPNLAQAYAQLGIAQADMYWFYFDRSRERLALAEAAVDRALQIAPDLPEAHLARGWYYYHGELDYGRALEEFEIVRRSQPTNSDLLAAIAYVQRAVGPDQFAESIENLRTAVEYDPRNQTKLGQLGISYFYMRRYPEALRYFDRAISLAPDVIRPYAWKARLHVTWQGDTATARAVLDQAARRIDSRVLDTRVWEHWTLLRVLEGNGAAALERLATLDLDSAFYHLAAGELFSLMERPEPARAHYDSARSILEARVAAMPDEPRFHANLGLAYAGLGRAEEAVREGLRAVEIMPYAANAFHSAEWVQKLAQIYVLVGDYGGAIEQLEFVLSIPGSLSGHWLRLDPIWEPLWDHPRFPALADGTPRSFYD
jgi:TolB-like protein/Tfp pilus assembly protein PilF